MKPMSRVRRVLFRAGLIDSPSFRFAGVTRYSTVIKQALCRHKYSDTMSLKQPLYNRVKQWKRCDKCSKVVTKETYYRDENNH